MNTLYLAILLAVFIASHSGKSVRYPHTLLNTDVRCDSIKDCLVYYNHSWCASAGVLCIHHYCKLVPEYPCRSTQDCLEEEQVCRDKKCVIDEDCNNGVYCDGEEICVRGHCLTDPQRPSCHYTGGGCDEQRQQCYQPKVRLAWDKTHDLDTEDDDLAFERQDNTNAGGHISQLSANMTTLIIIGSLTGLFVLFVIFVYIGRSMYARR